MAQLTKASIQINGKSISQFTSFSLSQGIYGHHSFRLTCPAEAIDGTTGIVFNKSKTWMGKPFIVKIDTLPAKDSLQFKGVVTQIQTERYSGSPGDVVISGFSPTIMLESGAHCKTWEKKAVKNIIEDVLKHFPKNDLSATIAPSYPDTLAYYVQYKETAWRFLSRICSSYGEWLYYDGQKLKVGPLNNKAQQLTYGKEISRFSMSLEVLPSSKKVMAYDYKNNEVYDSTPAGIESKAGFSSLGKDAFNAGKELYKTEPKIWNNTYLTNKNQLDKQVNIQAAMLGCNNEKFNGTSSKVGLIVGSAIGISGKNIYNAAKDDYGEYTIVSVNHYCDGQGNYSNDFVAVPSSVNYPPISVREEPTCETQSAIVTDNNDPQHLGRVRVRFHWMKPSEKTPWIRVTSPHGGGDKGMFFIPEIGEEAIICFEGNSAVKPFVNGTVYHGKAKTSFANAGNDVKALQTRSGNKMVMNDKDGSVLITDKGPADFTLNGAGNADLNATKIITLKAGEQISLICGESSITLYKDGTIIINGKKIFTDGTTSVAITSGESSGMVIKPSTIDAGSKTTTVSGTSEINVGGAKVNVGGGAEVNVSSGKISMN
jgi:type VI secretion system secreted protein VgrG